MVATTKETVAADRERRLEELAAYHVGRFADAASWSGADRVLIVHALRLLAREAERRIALMGH